MGLAVVIIVRFVVVVVALAFCICVACRGLDLWLGLWTFVGLLGSVVTFGMGPFSGCGGSLL